MIYSTSQSNHLFQSFNQSIRIELLDRLAKKYVPIWECYSSNKIKPAYSDCCLAEIGTRANGYDYCMQCNASICYGLVGCFDYESMAVCRLYDDKLWFFWQSVYNWQDVLESKQEYIGQIKDVVDSARCYYNTEEDLLMPSEHRQFCNLYKFRVENPEWSL